MSTFTPTPKQDKISSTHRRKKPHLVWGFKEKVLAVVAKIPKGKILTYKQVAKKAGSPRAFRAVGTIMKHNTDPKHIPCHRVVRSDGTAGRYSGTDGTKGKIRKLRSEGVVI